MDTQAKNALIKRIIVKLFVCFYSLTVCKNISNNIQRSRAKFAAILNGHICKWLSPAWQQVSHGQQQTKEEGGQSSPGRHF